MMRSESEIKAEFDRLDPEAVANGESSVPGMTYEQGVETALMWVLGHSDDKPCDD